MKVEHRGTAVKWSNFVWEQKETYFYKWFSILRPLRHITSVSMEFEIFIERTKTASKVHMVAKKGLLAKLTRNLMAEIKSEEVVYNDLCRKLVEANRALKAATDKDSNEQSTIREAAHCHYLPTAVLNHQSAWYEAATAAANETKEMNNNTGK